MNKKSSLLVIEDEIVNIEIFKELLKNDYLLKIAETGTEAINIMESSPPDIVLLDMILPDISGIDLCHRFKNDDSTSHIPIIIVTSLKNKKDKINGLAVGANDYLFKPIDGDELLLKVKNHLITKNLRDQLFDSFQNIVSINKELKKTDEKKSEILGIAAHDMRNPLTVILGRVDLLLLTSKPGSRNYNNIKSIKKSTEYLIELIADLLNTVTIDSGKIKPNIKRIDLGKLAESVVEINRSGAKAKNQKIEFSYQSNSFIDGDTMMLRGIMDNLISNGLKFSPPGSTIHINVISEIKKGIIKFSIIDEGPGLTREDKDKIFRRFQRLSAKPTGGESSTGLGLSIVKDYTEMHNGIITVENEPGKGSKFVVSLPLAKFTEE